MNAAVSPVPKPARSSNPQTVAEAYLMTLKARGVDYLFGNAGTDFAPIIEGLARAEADGVDMPKAVEIIHETLTVGMAHGYFLATGRPQAAMVHVNVGLANSLMGLINASRGQVPVLFASGRTPLTEFGRRGSRNAPIHWGQEMFDQGGLAREFVKWDHEIRAAEQIVALVDRSLSISMSEPKGPTYLSLPREILAERLPEGFEIGEPHANAAASPHPDPSAIHHVANLVAAARHPLVIISGGDQAIFDRLGSFAERFAVPVVQFWRTSCAIATNHPFYAGEVPKEELASADVVVVLNTMVPWMPGAMPLTPGAKVIEIGPDPTFADVPVRTFPSVISLTSSVAPALDALSAALDQLGYADSAAVADRRRTLVPQLAERRQRERAAGDDPGGVPMTPEYMTRVLNDVVGQDATIVNELGLSTGVLELTNWDSFYGPTISAGLGWGVPAALGMKLARPDKTVVACTGDGSYVFANPAACHHAAASLGLGLLTVVADNRVWNAVRRSTIAVYPEGMARSSEHMPLSSLEPAPDYPKLVEAYGGHGTHVAEPEELRPALERALEITASGRQALVSVHCSYPDAAHH